MNRTLRRSKKYKPYIKAITHAGPFDEKDAGDILDFAIECHKTYDVEVVTVVEIIVDMKQKYPEHDTAWLIDNVREGLVGEKIILEELLKAGVSGKAAKELVKQVVKIKEQFDMTTEEALDAIINAVGGRNSMTPEEMQEIAVQLDEAQGTNED